MACLHRLAAFFVSWLACGLLGLACARDAPPGAHPTLMVTAAQRENIRSRIDREPYATLLGRINERAARDYHEEASLDEWDHAAHGQNGLTAEANAFLAWLLDDAAAASKARDFFRRLPTHFDRNSTIDVNIRMPAVLIGYTNAWDLLAGTSFFPEPEAHDAKGKITDITRQFYQRYVEDSVYRTVALLVTQNNHPIRTACAIGYPALLFRDHPDADAWLNWATSELEYLWGENGHYVQADGGISEEPFYYGFAFAPTIAFHIAHQNSMRADHLNSRTCISRSDLDPWRDHGCVEGEAFRFTPLLGASRFQDTATWSIALRLPSGHRPPLGDGALRPTTGQAVLTGFGAPSYFRWDWENHETFLETQQWHDLTIHHLAYFDDGIAAMEPPFTTRFFPETGNAVFRSDWSRDAIWLLLLAEAGSARKTIHDHVDSTSFSMAAYGEYLLIDTGYYKPSKQANALTANAPSHNVILIDGKGAPDKGLLTHFGDTDAMLKNTFDGNVFDSAEAWQTYEETSIQRSLVFVRSRYAVVADRLTQAGTSAREHRFRVHGNAGLEAGGQFRIGFHGGVWERGGAGVAQYLGSTAKGLYFEKPEFRAGLPPHVHAFEDTGRTVHHEVLDGVVTALAPGFLTVLAPYRQGVSGADPEGPLTVLPVAAADGQVAWQVKTSAGQDLVLLRTPFAPAELTLPDGRLLSTDAELLILGLDDGAVFLARGSRVSLDGSVIASAVATGSVAETQATR